MSEKYVNIVFNKVDCAVRAVLGSITGGCFQYDGWTDPNGEQVFNVLFGAPLLFYNSSSGILRSRESADTLVTKDKKQLVLVGSATNEFWRRSHNTGIVSDSPNESG